MTESGGRERVEIRRGFPEGAEDRIAELYWEAFGRKLGAALGPEEQGRAFLAAHLVPDRTLVALSAGRVVGVAGLRTGTRGMSSAGAGDVLKAYGWLGGLPRLAALALLEHAAAPGELVLECLAVDARRRGLGTGGALLRACYAYAAEAGCSRVGLQVVDGNPRARALYEREGFRAVGTQRTPFLRELMGFSAVTTMHRPITPGAAP
ncbi:GNAT family N-acetyltransferase [Streptomyces sp. NPDC086023]|uniref:GNAT family N-acetyltransferase n=1 Tax=Streptomyces sp. NPDC086023 TaxID=3365746 RepID=UPI0037D031FA